MGDSESKDGEDESECSHKPKKRKVDKVRMHIRESQLNILLLQCIPISDYYLAMLVPYVIDIKSAHDRMVCET